MKRFIEYVERVRAGLAVPRGVIDAVDQLQRFGIDKEHMAEALTGAAMLAQLGVRPEQIQDMVKAYHATKARGITHEDLMDLGSIKRRAFMDGFRAKGEEEL